MAVCTGITQVPEKNGLLKVTIDNDVEAFWFYDYSDAMQYLNQEVIVDYRKDILGIYT